MQEIFKEQIRKPVAFLRKTTTIGKKVGEYCYLECLIYNACFLSCTVMLSWFLDHQVKEAVLARKQLVEEEDVEIRPERIPSACFEEDVCIQSIQKYFSIDAWCALTNVLDVLRSNLVWYCGICQYVRLYQMLLMSHMVSFPVCLY